MRKISLKAENFFKLAVLYLQLSTFISILASVPESQFLHLNELYSTSQIKLLTVFSFSFLLLSVNFVFVRVEFLSILPVYSPAIFD